MLLVKLYSVYLVLQIKAQLLDLVFTGVRVID